jgi:5-hydroxyisourate hydrolase
MSGLSTHVLDMAQGLPAAGVVVTLAIEEGGWKPLASGTTNADGRISPLLPVLPRAGLYRVVFATGDYFRMNNQPVFYPEVSVLVQLDPTAGKYHIPLLISPFGYSTYRGS